MSRPAKTPYKTTNWHSYNQALRQRGSLTVWFDPSMQWETAPSGRRGRQQAYSDAAIQACLTIKVLLGLPLRQTTGFVASLLELSGLGWAVPDFSTLSRRQKTLDVTIPYRGSKGAIHLLVDSTGIKVEGEGEWHARKHGGSKRRVWRKIHLGIDEETLEIRAVEVTSSNVGDAPMLPNLLAQISANEDIATVTADGAYDTRACHDAIAARGAAAIGHSLGPCMDGPLARALFDPASGRSRPCIRRPRCSDYTAARPDEVSRRSGPDQWHALKGASVRTGCPVPRITAFVPSPHAAPHHPWACLSMTGVAEFLPS